MTLLSDRTKSNLLKTIRSLQEQGLRVVSTYHIQILCVLVFITIVACFAKEPVRNFVIRSFQHDFNIWFYTDRIKPFPLSLPIVQTAALMAGLCLGKAMFQSTRWIFLFLFIVLIPPVYAASLLFVVFIVWWSINTYQQKKLPSSTFAWAFAAAFILSVGLRLDAWMHTAFAPLVSDVEGVVDIAETTRWFYDTDWREPVWVNLVKITRFLFGSRDNWVITLPFFLVSLTWVPIIYYFGSRIFDRNIALLAIWLVAVNRSLVYYSTRGMRVELFGILLFIVYAYPLLRIRFTERQMVTFVLSGILVSLTRIHALGLTVYSMGVALLRKRCSWANGLWMTIVIFIFVMPYPLYQYVMFGNTLHTTHKVTAWMLGTEQGGKDEMIAQGGVTLKEYTLRHKAVELVVNYVKGLYRIFLSEHAAYVHFVPFGLWWALMYLTGLACCLLAFRTSWFIPHIVFGMHLVPAFVGAIYVDWRHILSLYPTIALITAYGYTALLSPQTVQTLAAEDNDDGGYNT